jgi:hypothetical protein
MWKFRKFWSLTRREKQFLFEACVLLLLSTLSVKTVAFRHIESYLRIHWNDHSRDVGRPDDIKNEIKLVNLSLARAANVLPWKSLCLSRSIAGLIMLRRRRIPAVLLAGVKSLEDSSLHAHAWVRTGNGVMDWNLDGDSDDSAFTILVRIGHEPLLDSSRNAVY